MVEQHIRREDLIGKTIDIHSCVGIQIKEAAHIEFPYCASVEDPSHRQRANEVDVAVVFPASPTLYFNLPTYIGTGRLIPAARPISRATSLAFFAERNWPILFHVAVSQGETYSQAAGTLQVIERHPGFRFCLAHAIGMHRGFLERADALPNACGDTAALKIQVELAYEKSPLMALPPDQLNCDLSNHIKFTQALVERFPRTIIWGTDSPWHSYISRCLRGDGVYADFRLKGTYEHEKAALDVLSPVERQQIMANALAFLFG